MESETQRTKPVAAFMAFGTNGDVYPIAAIAAAFACDQKQYHVVLITHSAHEPFSSSVQLRRRRRSLVRKESPERKRATMLAKKESPERKRATMLAKKESPASSAPQRETKQRGGGRAGLNKEKVLKVSWEKCSGDRLTEVFAVIFLIHCSFYFFNLLVSLFYLLSRIHKNFCFRSIQLNHSFTPPSTSAGSRFIIPFASAVAVAAWIVNLYRKIWTWMLIIIKFWDCPLVWKGLN
ncbi:hypothetical protein LWI29_005967 [Acer saccharum]|uniref:Uncharacterized protein n=1 Tax=Acer saccharum TaxID=4024 RepID=A0AA39RVB3_ACESA|nr:hypothetical protein LWI29_005967 [Acer saccharum]